MKKIRLCQETQWVYAKANSDIEKGKVGFVTKIDRKKLLNKILTWNRLKTVEKRDFRQKFKITTDLLGINVKIEASKFDRNNVTVGTPNKATKGFREIGSNKATLFLQILHFRVK